MPSWSNLLSLNPCLPSATPIDISVTCGCGPPLLPDPKTRSCPTHGTPCCTSRVFNHKIQMSSLLHPVKANILIALFASKSKIPICNLENHSPPSPIPAQWFHHHSVICIKTKISLYMKSKAQLYHYWIPKIPPSPPENNF